MIKLTVEDNNPLALEVNEEPLRVQVDNELVNIGTDDYEELENKPSINDVELIGDKTSSELGLADKVHTHTKAQITDFPVLATVATSGKYSDLTEKPVIPEEQIFSVILTEDEDEVITASETFADIVEAYDNGKYITVKFVDMDGYGSDLVLTEVAEDDGYINMRDMSNPVGYWAFQLYDDESITKAFLQPTTNDLTNNSMFTRGNRAIWQGTCSTNASTSAKTVPLGGFNATDQAEGVMVVVTFANTNTASVSGLTLNVQNRGAKPIKRLVAGQLADLDSASDLCGTMPFVYDGTNWVTWYDTNSDEVVDVEVNGDSVVSGGVAEITITDENLKQTSASAPSYSYWRPLLVGDSSSSSEGFTPTSKTGGSFTFPTLQAQPSTGSIRMGRASLYQGGYTSKISPDTLTDNRDVTVPDKSGTIAMTSDIPNSQAGIFYGTCSSEASDTTKAVACAGFTASDLKPGAVVMVTFDNTNSGAVADLKLDVNSTGAYGIKRNNSGTIGNLDGAGYLKAGNTYPFIFDGSYWQTVYDTNTNTIGYTIRTNGLSLPMKSITYRYRLLFTSADGNHYVPANSSSSTNATASRTVTTEKIDPFGRIVYYGTTASVSAGSRPSVSYQYQQYNSISLGYSFNRTGSALTLTAWKPIYIKCIPQADGSAIIDPDTPFVQDKPTTNDGYIYIFLGVAISATAFELTLEHPVYWHDGTALRLWTGAVS